MSMTLMRLCTTRVILSLADPPIQSKALFPRMKQEMFSCLPYWIPLLNFDKLRITRGLEAIHFGIKFSLVREVRNYGEDYCIQLF